MDDYSKEKWSADFPDRAGQEVRPNEAVDNTLDYDVCFPQYLAEDPVVFNQQNRTVPSSSVTMPACMNASRRRQRTSMPI